MDSGSSQTSLNALIDLVEHADSAIRPLVRETPLERSSTLSIDGSEVWLKEENLQHTGSFKVRGAVCKMLAMSEPARQRGVIAASTGNHGAAVAYAAKHLNIPSIVYVPDSADSSKVAAIQRWGSEVRYHGDDGVVSERFARHVALKTGQTYLSPYNDTAVVAGQGTIAAELVRQADLVDYVFVSVGGGGLASGIGAYLRRHSPETKVVGCSPENSAVMIESIRAGGLLDLPSRPTLSDGTAGGVESEAITFDLCRTLVDEYVTVSEQQIADALVRFVSEHHMLIEGSAAVALAGLAALRHRLGPSRVAVVLCGANISVETLRRVLCDAKASDSQ